MSGIYLALGSNLGDREANIREALRRLAEVMTVEVASSLYESKPQPPADGPDYLNAACRVGTELPPLALLYMVKGIEVQMGRKSGARWSPRPIDIDIALYNDAVIEREELRVPHKRLAERDFVLQPLLDIDPELVDPATGRQLSELLAEARSGNLRRLDSK